MIGGQMKNGIHFYVRWMIARDMPDVVRNELTGTEAPWLEEDYMRHLRRRNVIGLIAEANDGIVRGQMVYELHKYHFRLLRFGVATVVRRIGIGSLMMRGLIGKLNSQRRRSLMWCVDERETETHLFLRAMDFRCTNVLRDHFGAGIDGYNFCYALQPANALVSEEEAS